MAKPKVSHLQETKKSDQQLGTLIAGVLNHPDLPEGVYNSIGDALAELQSKPGHSTRPETLQAVIDAAKERAAEPKADEGDDSQPDLAEEPDLRLPMYEFRQLQRVWYAIGEISEMADAPENDGGGLACLKIVNDQGLGAIMAKLQAQIDLREKGGAA
jgi:hypothetical protein